MTFLFLNSWIWLIFLIIGLLLIITELIVGVDTGLDLVFIGTSFVIAGLVSWPIHNWIVTVLLTCAICFLYVFLGRTKIKDKLNGTVEKTNIETIIGMVGVALENFNVGDYGSVKVRNEVWRACSDEPILKDSQIIVESLSGVTLKVKNY